MRAIKFPNEIWLEIISHRHNGNLQSVCKLFNEYIDKNKIQFLKSGFNIPHCKEALPEDYYKCECDPDCFEKLTSNMNYDRDNTIDHPPRYIQSNYVTINFHTMKSYKKQWDSAVILRIPGGRCVWITYSDENDIKWDIQWVLNNTSLSRDNFITFCTELMIKLLPQYERFFGTVLNYSQNVVSWNEDTYDSHMNLFPLISYK